MLFFETINGYQRSAAVKTAIELELFTAIGEGATIPEAIAFRCQASVRGTRVLADYLAVLGFITKHDGHYALTPDSAVFLDRRSPTYVGDAIGFLTDERLKGKFDDLTACVRLGRTVAGDDGTMSVQNPIWLEFARSMGKLQSGPAEQVAQLLHVESSPRLKVLDIASGHGMYGIAVARHNPHADVVAVDWPGVLLVARENAGAAGIVDSWRPLPGSVFEIDLGTGYDLALVTGFLHHFDPPTNAALLHKIKNSLAPHGRAAIVEFVPDDGRLTPPPAALFPLTMLVSTRSGDAYTFAEYRQMIADAGFTSCELHDIPNNFQRLIVATV
ncbi:MAG: methyltransferase domain-containing protein [Acidobacteriia bacterium]|nr:methyltransferase domain-containing protein [Terriglobia bacterium]